MSRISLTEPQLKHYIEKCKEFERLRTSTNDRNKYWKEYLSQSRTETSSDMNKFGQYNENK